MKPWVIKMQRLIYDALEPEKFKPHDYPITEKLRCSYLEKRLDGCYPRLLMRGKNLSWKKHPTLNQIYGNLVPPSTLVRQLRTQFAGHRQRASNEIISSLIRWKPQAAGRKGRKIAFPDVISRDTGIRPGELKSAMEDMDVWRRFVQSVVSTEVEK